ncbi:MAG: hypothetical protein Q9191_006816, partial [Dirinaria sp. TL-2023a]
MAWKPAHNTPQAKNSLHSERASPPPGPIRASLNIEAITTMPQRSTRGIENKFFPFQRV